MSDTGIFRVPHHGWQRANVIAAATFLREVLADDPDNARVKALHDGLLEVLDPNRRVARQQRELAALSSGMQKAERRQKDRRVGADRRQRDIGVPAIMDRRSGVDRRKIDRRKR